MLGLNPVFHCMIQVVLVLWWFHWDCILGCNWHIQLSLMYSAFHARNAIEHFGSTLVLTSPSYWSCIFSMTEMNVRNVKSKVINWQCLCNPITSFAIYVHSSFMTWCVLMVPDDLPVSWSDNQGSWGTGHQETICQNRSYSHSLITVHFWRIAQETCDLSKLLCRLDPEHGSMSMHCVEQTGSFSKEPCRKL